MREDMKDDAAEEAYLKAQWEAEQARPTIPGIEVECELCGAAMWVLALRTPRDYLCPPCCGADPHWNRT